MRKTTIICWALIAVIYSAADFAVFSMAPAPKRGPAVETSSPVVAPSVPASAVTPVSEAKSHIFVSEASKRAAILAATKSLEGKGEATGRNDGPTVEAVLASVGLRRGDPYCAATNYWLYRQAGVASIVPRSGWSPDWVKDATWKRGKGQTPKPADTWGLAWTSGGEFRVRHTGLVLEWKPNGVVVTFEGNTSPDAAYGTAEDRDAKKGGGFYSKRRLQSQVYAVRNWF